VRLEVTTGGGVLECWRCWVSTDVTESVNTFAYLHAASALGAHRQRIQENSDRTTIHKSDRFVVDALEINDSMKERRASVVSRLESGFGKARLWDRAGS
jgi:hypothetical protein